MDGISYNTGAMDKQTQPKPPSSSAVIPSGVPVKSLFEEAECEAHRHKWIESEKAGRDLGDFAVRDWHQRYWRYFHRERWIQHLRGQVFWRELDNGDFNLLSRRFGDRQELTERIVRMLIRGGENLGIIDWAVAEGVDEEEVLSVLRMLDVNAARLSSSLPEDGEFVVEVNRRHQPRALVVDDEETIRDTLSSALKDAGLGVVQAESAEKAFHEMERRRFDLFMIDVMLPGRHGAEIAYYLRRHGVEAPVVAVSPSPERWHADDLLDCGFTRILSKPFRREEILEIGRTAYGLVAGSREAG